MLLDSNIIIYAIKPEFDYLRKLIADHSPAVSAISYLEVLGYHKITPTDKQDFAEFFNTSQIVPISHSVLVQAVKVRQQHKISLGDSIVAATAMLNNLTLITANVKDFKMIQDLKLMNPLIY
ncbi:MAG: type II toxin-antitoxin system VapC family toxin [Calditrichaeota bacterium]|nr:MAG: type II toxin-antitoxin system VapC family toxin [Calditrichota bacterium]